MFAGIGGFRSGLSHYGDFFVPVGYCEIDPYAKRAYEAIYEPKGEIYFEDARGINPENLPDIDLICGGFPCQSFSIAGKRGGFADARGTLFFEIARIARVKRPAFLLLENVPGLLSHDSWRTFATILGALDELGYDVAWQVLNSANFDVPQNRERVFLIGYLRGKSTGEILSFTEANPKTIVQRIGGHRGNRVYAGDGLSCTLTSTVGGFAGNTGLYFLDMNPDPKITELARCITARQDSGISNHRGEHSGVIELWDGPCAFLTPDRENVRQKGRRMKFPGEPMFALTTQDRHGIFYQGRIRKLTPLECWRLQGFTDEQFFRARDGAKLSDTRLYHLAGNAVSVPVITALGGVIRRVYENSRKERENHTESCNQSIVLP